MAAVRPAGPEPMMMTLRRVVEVGLVMEFRSRSSVRRVTLHEAQRAAEAQDSPDEVVAHVDGARRGEEDVEQDLQAPDRTDDQQHERSDAEERGEQAEDDATCDVNGRL